MVMEGGYIPAVIGRPPSVFIAPGSREALWRGGGWNWALPASGGDSSNAWPTASLSVGFPFSVSQPYPVVRMAVMNGTTVSGNLDLGIYDDTGTLLTSKGSTAQSGTSAIQIVTVTSYTLNPGKTYYAFLALDNITATTRSWTASVTAIRLQISGLVQVASNFPLATGVTFAKPTNAQMPNFGLSKNTLI